MPDMSIGAQRPDFAAMRAKMMQRFDTNGDGQLSPDEQANMRQQMQARRAQMMKRFDTNGDGQLSPEERANMRAAFQARRAQMQQQQQPQTIGGLNLNA